MTSPKSSVKKTTNWNFTFFCPLSLFLLSSPWKLLQQFFLIFYILFSSRNGIWNNVTICHWEDDCNHEIKRCLFLGRKAMTNLDSILKSKDITLLIMIHIVKAMVFPVVMFVSESCTIRKGEHYRTDAFKLWCWSRLSRPLDFKIKAVNPEGNQHCIFIGRNDAETEAPILCPSDGKSWLIGKEPDAGKYWGKKEKGATEDEMIGWHHWLNEHEFEQVSGDSEGQGSLVCCSPWSF